MINPAFLTVSSSRLVGAAYALYDNSITTKISQTLLNPVRNQLWAMQVTVASECFADCNVFMGIGQEADSQRKHVLFLIDVSNK